MNPIPHPPTPGTVARLAIGCVCKHTGQEGDYLYDGEHPSTSRCSPVWPNLREAFPAIRALNWQDTSGGVCSRYTFNP